MGNISLRTIAAIEELKVRFRTKDTVAAAWGGLTALVVLLFILFNVLTDLTRLLRYSYLSLVTSKVSISIEPIEEFNISNPQSQERLETIIENLESDQLVDIPEIETASKVQGKKAAQTITSAKNGVVVVSIPRKNLTKSRKSNVPLRLKT